VPYKTQTLKIAVETPITAILALFSYRPIPTGLTQTTLVPLLKNKSVDVTDINN